VKTEVTASIEITVTVKIIVPLIISVTITGSITFQALTTEAFKYSHLSESIADI
jgi:hypothetical protein